MLQMIIFLALKLLHLQRGSGLGVEKYQYERTTTERIPLWVTGRPL